MLSTPRNLRNNVPLAPFTSFDLGGAARYFVEASRTDEIEEALAFARAEGLAVAVLGGGTNLVVADGGFPGLVVRVHSAGQPFGVDASGPTGRTVHAAAGESLDRLVAYTVEAGWAGLECLSGVPGTVGAAPIQNVGAYGKEVSDSIVSVRLFDREAGAVRSMDAAACGFGYRTSAFKHELRERFIVLSVSFALAPGGAPNIRYAELARALASAGSEPPSLASVRRTVLALRRAKGMLVEEGDARVRSAGSFFVNPVVDQAKADAILARLRQSGRSGAMPMYPATEAASDAPGVASRVKLSAAWLIEQAGYVRGTLAPSGTVALSSQHALAVVNRGGATAAHVVSFGAEVRRAVHDRFGVALVPEPVFWGFSDEELEPLRGAL